MGLETELVETCDQPHDLLANTLAKNGLDKVQHYFGLSINLLFRGYYSGSLRSTCTIFDFNLEI